MANILFKYIEKILFYKVIRVKRAPVWLLFL